MKRAALAHLAPTTWQRPPLADSFSLIQQFLELSVDLYSRKQLAVGVPSLARALLPALVTAAMNALGNLWRAPSLTSLPPGFQGKVQGELFHLLVNARLTQ
jgi:hypothetical protein